MNKWTNRAVLIALIVVLPAILMFTDLMSYIYLIPSDVVSLLIVYGILVYPQYQALYAIKIVVEKAHDEYATVKPDRFNWIPIVNDFTLASNFTDGEEGQVKKWLALVFKVCAIVFPLTLIYFNFFAFSIQNPALTAVLGQVELYSLIVYAVLKTIILGSLINTFSGGIVKMATALVHPLGFIVLTGMVKHYLTNLQDTKREDSMGLEYEWSNT